MVTPEFYRAGELVPLVVFSIIIYGCHNHFEFGILYSKKTKYVAYINLICAIFNIGLNYTLISSFGLFGGVWSAIIILGFQALLLYYASDKFYHIDFQFRRIFLYMLIAILFYILSKQIQTSMVAVNLLAKIFLLVLFPFIITALKIISINEKAKIKEIYHNRIRSRIFKKTTVTDI